MQSLPVPIGIVERRIYLVRGHKVMLDSDLAELYKVPTFRLNEAVKRNRKRFPDDFMFQLNAQESIFLTSQIAMSKVGRGGRRTSPYVFTEQGVAMLSSVLNSERAVQMNIVIMRAFVRLREILVSQKDLAMEIEKLKREQGKHGSSIKQICLIIEKLLKSPKQAKRKIGFRI